MASPYRWCSSRHFAFFTTLAFVAAVGLPGTAGFVAELSTLIGGFQRWGWLMVLLSVGVLVSATYAVRTVGRLFTGPVRAEMQDVQDLRPHELVAASALTLGVVGLGFFPAPAIELIATSVGRLSAVLEPVSASCENRAAPPPRPSPCQGEGAGGGTHRNAPLAGGG